jgi:hypothetical protein
MLIWPPAGVNLTALDSRFSSAWADQLAVGIDARDVGADLRAQARPAFCARISSRRLASSMVFGQREILLDDLEPAGFHLAEVEDVVDQESRCWPLRWMSAA